jgi:CheY-like chemotaxis protein
MNETVLVVDAQSERRGRLQGMLSGFGYRVVAAADRAGGLHAVATAKPKVLLIDASLPGVDPMGFVRTVKRRSHLAAVLVLTDRTEIMERLRRLADGFVGSDIPAPGLETMVRGACSRVNLRRRLASQPARIERRLEKKMRERIETNASWPSSRSWTSSRPSSAGFPATWREECGISTRCPISSRSTTGGCGCLPPTGPTGRCLAARPGRAAGAFTTGAAGEPEGCPVSRTLRAAEAQESREVLCYRSGAKVPVIVHTAPIYDNDGDVDLVLEIAAGTQDINALAGGCPACPAALPPHF